MSIQTLLAGTIFYTVNWHFGYLSMLFKRNYHLTKNIIIFGSLGHHVLERGTAMNIHFLMIIITRDNYSLSLETESKCGPKLIENDNLFK